MSRFYGVVEGSYKPVHGRGSKSSGITVTAASWNGAIEVKLYVDKLGRDCYTIRQVPWKGVGKNKKLFSGIMNVDLPPWRDQDEMESLVPKEYK